MTTDKQEPNKRGGAVRSTVRIITLPVRSMVKSASLAGQSFKKSAESVGTIKDFSLKSVSNVKSAGKKGSNDTFESVFSGERGEKLLDSNLRKFLLRKRAAIAMMLLFIAYGMASVIVFQQFYGVFTFLGGVFFGATLCFESQFRLWQLRNRRLSVEEKGSVTNFLSESPLLDIFKPELFGSAKK